MNPGYYAIIPANVRYDKRLKANEKLMYAELTALSQKDGCCWAGNGYFAELYGVSVETVSRWFSHLQKCGYIRVDVNQSKGNERKIYVIPASPSCKKSQEVLTETSRGIDEKVKTPIDKKVKQNNTSMNNKRVCGDGTPKPVSEKRPYGEFQLVLLTEKDYGDLVRRMGKRAALDYIRRLDEWLAEGNGRRKANHHATLLRWYHQDGGTDREAPAMVHSRERTLEELKSRSIEELMDGA